MDETFAHRPPGERDDGERRACAVAEWTVVAAGELDELGGRQPPRGDGLAGDVDVRGRADVERSTRRRAEQRERRRVLPHDLES